MQTIYQIDRAFEVIFDSSIIFRIEKQNGFCEKILCEKWVVDFVDEASQSGHIFKLVKKLAKNLELRLSGRNIDL